MVNQDADSGPTVKIRAFAHLLSTLMDYFIFGIIFKIFYPVFISTINSNFIYIKVCGANIKIRSIVYLPFIGEYYTIIN